MPILIYSANENEKKCFIKLLRIELGCVLYQEEIYIGGSNTASVLWKRLNTETSQRGNASKTGFEEFLFFLGNPSKLKNVEGFPNIFEALPNI